MQPSETQKQLVDALLDVLLEYGADINQKSGGGPAASAFSIRT